MRAVAQIAPCPSDALSSDLQAPATLAARPHAPPSPQFAVAPPCLAWHARAGIIPRATEEIFGFIENAVSERKKFLVRCVCACACGRGRGRGCAHVCARMHACMHAPEVLPSVRASTSNISSTHTAQNTTVQRVIPADLQRSHFRPSQARANKLAHSRGQTPRSLCRGLV